MEIINHILHDKQGKALFQESPNHGTRDIQPKFVIMHCTDTASSMQNNIRSMLRDSYKASAHLLIGRKGEIVQFVPFNLKAFHSGGGQWDFVKGNVDMNSWSLGIELLNASYLEENEAGEYHKRGAVIPKEDRRKLQHRSHNTPFWWQKYPKPQVNAAMAVTKLLFQNYSSLEDVLGHDEINPANRIDPGPAFPMRRFHAEVLGLDKKFPIKRVYRTIRTANLYNKPGSKAEIIPGSRLERNTPLGILKKQAGWAYIHVLKEIAGNQYLVGWIQRERIEKDTSKPRHYHKPKYITVPGKHD